MSEQVEVTTEQENKPNDKELNFRALEQKLAQEKQARMEAERLRQEAERKAAEFERLKATMNQDDDDDDDDEPYVDKKRLKKQLDQFSQKSQSQYEAVVKREVQQALDQERMNNWMKSNTDFYEVMQHADKLYDADPELAETILKMPDGFDRQKLVYKQIKNMQLHKAAQKESSIQEKIDQNRRSPYYQPSNVGTAPYGNTGDFSSAGKKSSYDKMQELKKRLRLS